MAFREIFIENPCKCSYQSGCMVIRTEHNTHSIHLSEFDAVCLETQTAYLSAYLLSELTKNKISLIIPDERHNPVGQLLPLFGAYNIFQRSNEQLQWSEPSKKRVWQQIIMHKINNQADVLLDCGHTNPANQLYELARTVKSGDTTNREAVAANIYFRALFGSHFSRDDGSPINGMLNYGYAILLSILNRELAAKGLLLQCGIYHRGPANPFNLSCDFMEPFRPVIDRIIVEGEFSELTREVKYNLIDMPNLEFEYKNGIYKLRSIIHMYISECINALNKTIPVSDISSFNAVS